MIEEYDGPIKHVVVLMLENRSYDNMLGWLYAPGNPSPFNCAPAGQDNLDGLVGKSLSNPNPTPNQPAIPVANQSTPTQVGGQGPEYPATTIPVIDPGEIFADMAQQVTGSSTRPTSNPYASWSPTEQAMQGYTLNYAQHGGALFQGKPPESNYQDVMNYFTPDQVPTTSMLANQYAVCDQWFSSAPTQTFSNRAFSQCAAPGVMKHIVQSDYFSLIDDTQYFLGEFADLPSVFSQLDANGAGGSGPGWKVYFHDYSISVLTVPYVKDVAKSDTNQNVACFDDSDWPGTNTPDWLGNKPSTFVEDAASGNLPPFTFIEPRYSNNYPGAVEGLSPNSNHPGLAHFIPAPISADNPPIDVADGELLLQEVYTALTQSPCWESTLFIITYDEGGGTFDHVAPPDATVPGSINWPSGFSTPFTELPEVDDVKAADGFDFNIYGGRVPAIIVSPYISPSSTIRPATGSAPFDHASIVKTVWDIFNLSSGSSGMASLNQRDFKAPSLVPFLSNAVVNK